ncbi:MAG: protein kinase [bacterium]|nr:protein kinase [bacterium]
MTKNNQHPLALPVGTELVGDYVITKVLGAGGFGITYEANERSLDRTVAIKEYFPVDIVEREGWALVKARSTTLDMKYARGLRRFIEEAKAITQFNHPNIVRVLRYFKTNNTAFMVLHYEEGLDMRVWRDGLNSPPTENQLTAIIKPLLNALELIHSNDFLHRDVAPDNIIIRKDGSPILIDFGSARSELTFNSKTVSALVKSGYSPFEQYAKNSKEQGPWTDIYSFGATLYQMVTGEAPPDSLSRLAADEMTPAKKRAKRYYSRDFLAAIDSALAIRIEDRPQSINEWRSLLFPAKDQASTKEKTPKKKKVSLLAAHIKDQKSPFRLPRRSEKIKKSGQASVADLIEKSGLKPAAITNNASRLWISVWTWLHNLVPNRISNASRRKARAQRKNDGPPAGKKNAANPRSLRTLLHELDEEYKDIAHEQAIEDVANLPSPPKIKKPRKPRKPVAPVFFAKIHKIWQTLKNILIKLFRSLSLLVRFAAGVVLLGSVALAINYYRPALTKIANKVEVPNDLKTSSTNKPPSPKRAIGKPKPKAKAKPKPKPVLAPPSHLLKTVTAHKGGVVSLLVSNSGEQLISSGKDQIIKIWDIASGSLTQSFEPHQQSITALDVLGERLVQGDASGNIFLFDLSRTEQLATFKALDGPISSVAFVGRGNDLLTGSNRGELDYWEFRDGEYSREKMRGAAHSDSISSIVTHRRYFVSGSADNSIKLWRRSRKRLIRTYLSHDGVVNAVTLSPKAYRMASGSSDGTIKIWSPKSRHLRRTLQAQQDSVSALAFAQNGKWLASGGKDHTIKIWNARNGQLVRLFKGHTGMVQRLLFSPDKKQLISASEDGSIRYWQWNSR